MEDIKRVKLSEIVELITKGTTPTTLGYEFQDEGVNFLKIECFDENGGFIESKVAHISEECHKKMKRSQLKNGDILFSIAGAIGRVAIVTEEMLPANINQALAIIRISDEQVYLPYIKLILTSPIVIEQFERKKQGVAQLNLSLKDINEISIPLPSKDKQIELAELFDKVVGVISKRNKELSALDDLIKARFVELFECGDHEIVKASDVCDFITKGTTPPTGEITEEYENGKIPFLKVYNLSFTGEMLFDENPQYILAETHNGKLARSKVYPNDVLMNIVGPPLGKFTLVTDEFEEWNINQAIAIFRAKERILPRFLLHALMQPKVLEPFIGQAVGIRQQNLSLEQCRNLQFPLPSLEEQKSFVEFAEQLDKSKVAVQKALDETQMLFDSLMQKYFA